MCTPACRATSSNARARTGSGLRAAITRHVFLHERLGDYIQRLVAATRPYNPDTDWLIHSPSELVETGVDLGASPRAIIVWGRLAKVWALLVRRRDEVYPEDIQDLAPYVLGHRIWLGPHAASHGLTPEAVVKDVIEKVIRPALDGVGLDRKTVFHVNPTGRFVVGGPMGDAGLTGRKIIVDTYGGMGRHGGGAFSGKDPSKVDRSAAYAARWVAKNLVAAGLARRCEVQVAYAIGVAEPVMVRVDSFGTGRADDAELERLVRKHFDLTPKGINDSLGLRRPIFRATAYHGHFGREGFPWEDTRKAEALRRDAR